MVKKRDAKTEKSGRPVDQGLIPILIIIFVGFASAAFLFRFGKPELIPQAWLSLLVLLISYWAYHVSANKLRLDLFDKRFQIYERTLIYCSTVLSYANLEINDENRDHIADAISAAHESFRGIGLHKAKALFGPDIVKMFDELNESYAYIQTYGRQEMRNGNDFDADTYYRHVVRTVEMADKLPEAMKAYIYFGDVKIV